MKIMHVVPSLEDRHGGPSRSTRALAHALASQGNTIELVTTGEISNRSAPATSDAATIRTFPRVTPQWLTRSPQLRQHLLAAPADCIHNHALWLLPLHYAHEAAKKQNIPLVISPRGMMNAWAYQHRRWKKRLAEILVHPGAFAEAAGWHATSNQEADDIRALGFKQPVCVSPNGVSLPSEEQLDAARSYWHRACPASASRPVALFYSRFHQKKRVRELIDLWLSQPRGNWLLLMVGVPEEYHADEINSFIAAANGTHAISAFDGTHTPPPYAIASLFVLPSHSENFGLVIAEALAAGLPALVTDTTPWHGLASENAGWCVPWSEFPTTLDAALKIPTDELHLMGTRGRAWVDQNFSWSKGAQLLTDFYHQLGHERR